MNTLTSWLLTFWQTLVMPSPSTFKKAAKRAKRKFVTAMLWLIVIAVLYYCVYRWLKYGSAVDVVNLFWIMVALPMSIVVFVTAVHFFYRRVFHRKGDRYDETLYVTVAVFVVMALLLMGLSPIPGVVGRVVRWAVLAYFVVLLLIAIQTVTELDVGQSLIAVAVSLIVAGLVFVCLPMLVFSLSGSVTNIFR